MKRPRRVTAAEVKELWRQLNQGASLRRAAMKTNMDRKSARKYRDNGRLPDEARKPRNWRTRPDPLADVWAAVIEQLQQEPRLQAKTLWEWLQREQPGRCPESARRTFERRVRQWKARFGSAKEVFFQQIHEPGRLAASDFTSMNDLQVTIAGAPLPHWVYHFVLTHSNWEHATLCWGEDFASLSAGLQNALWALGAVPERHRTDRMTLAVHHDGQPEQFTAKYRALLGHYGMQAEATNPASGHENGDVESAHRHFKAAVEQALLLRGSRDFASRAEYWALVVAVLAQRNAGRSAKLAAEMRHLRPLPAGRIETLERERVRVRRGSTIRVKHNTYSVPSRLCGEEVEVRIGMEEIEVWYAQQLVQRMPRLRGTDKHRIDYRHIISWLVRKPGAFARYLYRDDLYPTLTFRRAYDALVEQQPGSADKEYVRLLHLASAEGEARVDAALATLLEQRQSLSEQAVRTLWGAATALADAAVVTVPAVDLRSYDQLVEGDYAGASDNGMSLQEPGGEESHDQGSVAGVDPVPAGAASAGGAGPIRGGGAASECRDVELSGVFTGGTGAGMSATESTPDRAPVEGVATAAGEELGSIRPEASAAEGGAAIPGAVERRLCGSPGECVGLWRSGFGEDPRAVCRGPGTGACAPACPIHDDGLAGAGTAGGQTRLDPQSVVEATEPLGSVDPGRLGLCATQPRGDGGVIHPAGGALRTQQCVPDQQSAVLEVGADLQRCHDRGGGDRPPGASQCHRGVERAQLPRRGGQTVEGQTGITTPASPITENAQRGPGSGWGMIIVARLVPCFSCHQQPGRNGER